MDRGELAKSYFMKGYNCSQAVVLAFADRTGFDEPTSAKLASSFGGGFGRMREVCGTFSGMVLVLGLLYGYDAANETETANKKLHYARVQALAERFRAEFGSIICRELLTGKAKEETQKRISMVCLSASSFSSLQIRLKKICLPLLMLIGMQIS